MDLQKRRTFIISFIYFAIIGVICYILFKRLIPMLMPFIMALAIAAALDPAVSYLGSRMKGGYRCAAAAVLLLFYGCMGITVSDGAGKTGTVIWFSPLSSGDWGEWFPGCRPIPSV